MARIHLYHVPNTCIYVKWSWVIFEITHQIVIRSFSNGIVYRGESVAFDKRFQDIEVIPVINYWCQRQAIQFIKPLREYRYECSV
jgi:hypothetical protein